MKNWESHGSQSEAETGKLLLKQIMGEISWSQDSDKNKDDQ